MITIKNDHEIELMREAGRIVALTHQEIKKHLVPGITTKELDAIAEKTIRHYGAVPSFKGYEGFPASICTSINQVVVHGIPGSQALKDGDLIAIDIGANYQGFHGDSAWSYAIGTPTPLVSKLLDVTEKALFLGLAQVKPGNRVTDISHAIQTFVESHGFSLPRDLTGHGVGRQLHEDPIIPNFGAPNRGMALRQGMTIAIEPMVNVGTHQTRVRSDGWTVVTADGQLSAHFEHTVLITDTGYEILTQIKGGI